MRVVTGDATQPIGKGKKVIAHVCNNIGAWGAGFVLAVSRRWAEPERVFRMNSPMTLGDVDFVHVEPDIVVANMCGQHGIKQHGGQPPIRYDALRTCLAKVARKALETNASVHMPRIGCGLAGGKWEAVEPIIREELISKGVSVIVYDLPRSGEKTETVSVNVRFQEYDVYCGRGKGGVVPDAIGEYGWLGNPIAAGKVCPRCHTVHRDGASTLGCYEEYLRERLETDPNWRRAFYQTCKGKRLGCFCKPRPCHTDVIIKMLDWIERNHPEDTFYVGGAHSES